MAQSEWEGHGMRFSIFHNPGSPGRLGEYAQVMDEAREFAIAAEQAGFAVEKRAAAGTVFDIPLKHITDATIRSHHQTSEDRVPDGPRADEIVIGLAAAAQGRPQARLAPLSTER
ncbi:amino acid synthesis family protein [Streptomyces sp. B21-108]|uniref:amino acid synthesis family protein n=1 Tax=Streptomyces sp. B21-108 TaxID=3039419 RepID=UPI002FF34632